MRVPGTVLLAITVVQAATALSAEEPPTFAFSWGSEGSGPGQFNWPRGVAVDGSGNVYVADMMNHRVQKFDGEGNYLTEWGSLGSQLGQFDRPSEIAVGADGEVFVAEANGRRIQVFSSDGVFTRYWVLGDDSPKGLAIAPQGFVYVGVFRTTDVQIQRILKFSNKGVLLDAWDGPEVYGVESVAADAHGHVYVGGSAKVTKLTIDGIYVLAWDLPPEEDFTPAADGLAVDAGGNVYAACRASIFEVKKYTSDGALLTEFCPSGFGEECFNIESVAIGPDGGVYLANVGFHRIDKYVYATPVTSRSWADVKSRYRRP